MKSVFRVIVVLSFVVYFQLNYNLSSVAFGGALDADGESLTRDEKCHEFALRSLYVGGFERIDHSLCEEPQFEDCDIPILPASDAQLGNGNIPCCCDKGPPPSQTERDEACNKYAKLRPTDYVGGHERIDQCISPQQFFCGTTSLGATGRYYIPCCCDKGDDPPSQ